jgi:hypothetical protein
MAFKYSCMGSGRCNLERSSKGCVQYWIKGKHSSLRISSCTELYVVTVTFVRSEAFVVTRFHEIFSGDLLCKFFPY